LIRRLEATQRSVFDVFVQIERLHFKDNAEVLAELEVLEHPNHSACVVSLHFVNSFEHSDFSHRVVEPGNGKVLRDLYSDVLSVLVVKTLNHLAKGATAKLLDCLIAVSNVVTADDFVETLRRVVATIMTESHRRHV
jgi:hypothetical protein